MARSHVRTPARLPRIATSAAATSPANTGPPRGARSPNVSRAAAHSVPENV